MAQPESADQKRVYLLLIVVFLAAHIIIGPQWAKALIWMVIAMLIWLSLRPDAPH